MGIINNSKVFIIDDNYEEAYPVIKAMAKRGIFTIYWDGSFEMKPESPLEEVRFVFLDMRLSAVTDDHTINTYLFTLLKSAISMENGPYVLLIWSKHDSEYLENFKNEISNVNGIPKPYLIINMEKNDFIKRTFEKNEVYDQIVATLDIDGKHENRNEILEVLKNNNINEINEVIEIDENVIEKFLLSLDEKLKQVNSLAILFMWEKIVNISARNLVNSITNLSELGRNWDNNIKTLIQRLAMANAGKSLKATAKDYVFNALWTLNQMLPDELWSELNKIDIDEEKYKFIDELSIMKTIGDNTYSIIKPNKKYIIKKNNSDYTSFKCADELEKSKEECKEIYDRYTQVLGKSNFKLLCERSVSNLIKKPGNVYEVSDRELLENLSDSILKNINSEMLTEVNLIKLDISSSCDYAQNKLKRVRILPGIMITEKYFSFINNTEDIYCTPELEINNELVKIAFNFNYITNESNDRMKGLDIIFSFRELILIEIKHKLSSYMSRVGIINL